ncbi:MAG: hypothetical protein ABOJ95_000346 [Wolbachia endosymbiont of Armadillidium vulgare]|uniref:Uncharacterized protein n=1 Tax=Wolbachia endosymbiont of Armadillidium arcangelii TaxID=3158571 RepID=A0AAU7Q4B0_9RICK|nr:hypothetical protein [Wolbachia endosymbiont of Armadillidium vulgare]OJH30858.1 hypothetical protein Wxf_00221 [Wolbachia endosymbiont of Armadillidium vulgare]
MTIVVTTTAAIEPLVDKRYYWLVEVIVLSPLFELGVLNKLCQTEFLIQLDFQSTRKEDVKLRHS